MNTHKHGTGEEGDSSLDELAVAIEADLELILRSKTDDPGTPDQWRDDPEEVQLEETDLHSLQGAVEALEPELRRDAGDAASS
jgi:hypothetical protein